MKAVLKNYRQSPRKVRTVANLVKGKSVKIALIELDFLPKRAALPLSKLIASALANAKMKDAGSNDSWIVKNLTVTGGPVLKRSMPRSHGMANPIKKRTSIVTVELAPKK